MERSRNRIFELLGDIAELDRDLRPLERAPRSRETRDDRASDVDRKRRGHADDDARSRVRRYDRKKPPTR